MPRSKTRIAWAAAVIFVLSSGGFVFRRELRIAYHDHAMRRAATNFGLLNGKPRMATGWENLWFSLRGVTSDKELDSIQRHQEALIDLGHFERKLLTLTNLPVSVGGRVSTAFSDVYTSATNGMQQQGKWWWGYYQGTTGFVMVATPEEVVRWGQIFAEADRKAAGK